MKVCYKKDLRHNYMVIEDDADREMEVFCIRMLEKRDIPGILTVEKKLIDNRSLLYYDITAKQSLHNLPEKAPLSCQRVRKLCFGILSAIEGAYDYFLPEDDFILSPEFIYIDITTDTPCLCLLPGYGKDIKEQMKDLLEYLMNKVDYKDKDAVYLVYQLYAVTREEGYTFGHMKEVLQNEGITRQAKEHEVIAGHIVNSPTSTDKAMVESPGSKAYGIQEANDKTADSEDGKGSKALSASSRINISFRRKRLNSEMDNIPVVMEKIESDTEISVYPFRTYLYAIACILGGIMALIFTINSGLIYHTYGSRIDYSKLAGLFVILLCVEGYLLNKILDKKNKVTKMVKNYEYIDPREDYIYHVEQKEPGASPVIMRENSMTAKASTAFESRPSGKKHMNTAVDYYQEDTEQDIRTDGEEKEYEPTCLLNVPADVPEQTPVLKACDEAKYKSIPITSLPFFIGKLRMNVDFCLESDTVSRYHAKISKEGDTYYLTDLNSTNGTYINQQLLQTYEKKALSFGDEVAFADIRYQFTMQ